MTEENRDETGKWLEGHSQPGPGRPSSYDESMNDVARKLALLGLTDEELATFFGVDKTTIYNWYEAHPAFFHSVQEGKVIADANVADSLYKRATGEHVTIEKIVKNAQTGESSVVKVLTYIPGEAPAAMNWLKNRRRGNWQDKVDLNHTGDVNLNVTKIELVPLESK
jgi:hypothetical protein